MEDARQKSQEDQLFSACQRGNLDEVKKLLSQNVDVNAKDRNGCTILFHCCHPQQLKLVRFLLNSGLNPNIANIRGNTVLHIACERGFNDIILILILYGADPYVYNLNGHRCDDLSPLVRPFIAGVYRDKSAFSLISEFHKKKLTQIFEDIDSDEAGFIDSNKSFKFNRFVDEITEDVARRDSQEFLREVSICKPGQVNLEEWLFSFGKLVRDMGNDEAVDKFVEDYERSIKEKGKYSDFRPRD